MNVLKALPLVLLLIGPVQAQSGDLVGKPCTMNGNMKGTCFYNASGEVSSWIVRAWRDAVHGGGPEGDEIVGYTIFLKEQQDYNRWAISASDPKLELHCWSSHHGWGKAERGLNSICVPNHIPESGELNLDTLRIPVFKTGVGIIAARDRLKKDCDSVTGIFTAWRRSQGIVDFSDTDICTLSDLPKDAEFADLQAILTGRANALAAAETASRRYDELITGLQYSIPIQYEFSAFTPERMPPGVADQLLALQAASDAALRRSDSLEKGRTLLTMTYRTMTAQAVQHHEAVMEKKACERLEKEWFEKYGEHYQGCGRN